MNSELVLKILDWLEKHLPGLLAAFGLGYKVGSSESAKLKQELSQTKMDLKEKEIELQVEKEMGDKPAGDVINDALSSFRSKPK